ncbi:hypothetical protein BIW11_01764 [Tropilaelaps mercedesae]|uniref:Uncharacterized protein n=1 Tax=Tropilaelaps mercedesae TaxID=418985 RepID=A0A1V9X925_9ACAR|nr:hypothetical protein BIW11_01764 [Tropilaelaps mercedesae]
MDIPDTIWLWLNLLFSAYFWKVCTGTLWKPESVVHVMHRVVPIAYPVPIYKHVKVPRYYPIYKQVHIPYPVKVPYWIPIKKYVPKLSPIAKVIPLPKVRIIKKPIGVPVPAPYMKHKHVPVYKSVPYKRTLYVPKAVKLPQFYPVHIHKIVHVLKPYYVPVAIPVFKPIFVKRFVNILYPVYIKKHRYHDGSYDSYGSHKHRGYTYSYGQSKNRPQYVARVIPKVMKTALVDNTQRKPGDQSYQRSMRGKSQTVPAKPWHTFGKPTGKYHVSFPAEQSMSAASRHRNPASDLGLNENLPPRKFHRASEGTHIPLPSSRPMTFDLTQAPPPSLLPLFTLAPPPPPPSLPTHSTSTKVYRQLELSHHRPQYTAHSMPHLSAENALRLMLLESTTMSLKEAQTTAKAPIKDLSQGIYVPEPTIKRLLYSHQVTLPRRKAENVYPTDHRSLISYENVMSARPKNQPPLHPAASTDLGNRSLYALETQLQKKTVWESIRERVKLLG